MVGKRVEMPNSLEMLTFYQQVVIRPRLRSTYLGDAYFLLVSCHMTTFKIHILVKDPLHRTDMEKYISKLTSNIHLCTHNSKSLFHSLFLYTKVT